MEENFGWKTERAKHVDCSGFWKSDEDSGMMGLAGGDADVHPYVSITVNLSA
jgi:hypothetical protein